MDKVLDKELISKTIVATFAEVLRVSYDEIDQNKSFYGNGGYSLAAIKALSAINKLFNTNIELAAFVNAKRIPDLSEQFLLDAGTRVPVIGGSLMKGSI